MDLPSSVTNLPQLFRYSADRFDALPAFAARPRGGLWEPLTFRELYERGCRVGAGLISLGVGKGEPVGVFSDNRIEWIQVEAGIQMCGAVTTPRGTDVTDEELVHILDHAAIRVCFVETPRMLARVERLTPRLSMLRYLILMTGEGADGTEVLDLPTLDARGATCLAEEPDVVAARVAQVGPDDLFTLIYTSGTTGHPKGVMLTHANILSQVRHVPLTLSCTDRVLSILPIWHIFERMFEVFTLSQGVCTYYTSIRTLGRDLQDVEPTFMGSAPRLWESLHHRITQGIREAHPLRRLLFHTAYFIAGLHHASMRALRNEEPEPPRLPGALQTLRKAVLAVRMGLLIPFYGFFNAAVLEAVRQKAGGSLKATISGGGALPAHIDRFFSTIGIQVLEGYGLTETSPVLAVRVAGKCVPRTVGPMIPGTEVRITDLESGRILYPDADAPGGGTHLRGEIQVRGPQVMKGYRNQPELTAGVLSAEGWFRTGDIGMVTWNGCLRILGRCKSTIVLSNGENVEPEPVEARVSQCPHVDQVYVCGQDRKHLYALIVPDLEVFQAEGHAAKDLAALAADDAVRVLILREVKAALADASVVSRHAMVRDIALVPKAFEVGEELTNLHKLKRHVIEKQHAALLREVYAAEDGGGKERA